MRQVEARAAALRYVILTRRGTTDSTSEVQQVYDEGPEPLPRRKAAARADNSQVGDASATRYVARGERWQDVSERTGACLRD